MEAIADFKSQKYEEAKGLKASTPEVHDDVAIDRQSEDSGSGAIRFRQICESEEKTPLEWPFPGIFKQKRMVVIFLARAFLAFYTST